jgi:hypothetical protein
MNTYRTMKLLKHILCYSENRMTKHTSSARVPTKLAATIAVVMAVTELLLTTSIFSATHQVFA